MNLLPDINYIAIAIPFIILGVLYLTAGILANTKRFGGEDVERESEKEEERG